jgi:hypothetical protein
MMVRLPPERIWLVPATRSSSTNGSGAANDATGV